MINQEVWYSGMRNKKYINIKKLQMCMSQTNAEISQVEVIGSSAALETDTLPRHTPKPLNQNRNYKFLSEIEHIAIAKILNFIGNLLMDTMY